MRIILFVRKPCTTELKATVNIIGKCFETRQQHTADVKEKMTIRFDGFHLKQSYAFVPEAG